VAGLSGTPGSHPVGCNEKAFNIHPPETEELADIFPVCIYINTPMFLYMIQIFTLYVRKRLQLFLEHRLCKGRVPTYLAVAKEVAWRFFSPIGDGDIRQ